MQTCQIFHVTGEQCDKPASGIVVPLGIDTLTWYKEGKGILCYKHGQSVKNANGGEYVMLAEIQHAIAAGAPADTDAPIPVLTLVQTPAPAAVPDVPAPVADVAPAPAAVEVPTAPAVHVPCAAADKLRAEAASLLAMAAADPSIAKLLQKAADVKLAEAAKLQADAAKGTPEQQWIRLLTAIAGGGASAVDALKAALTQGDIIRPVTVKEPKKAEGSTTAAPTAASGEREQIRQSIRDLIAQGLTDGAIGKQLGINSSTVYSTRKRLAA